MTQASQLEHLEPEIQRQILLEAETPSQVHSLIRASPRLYQVFLKNKNFVLSTVARRRVHPAALPDALTFAKASQLKQPLSRQDALRFCHIVSEDQNIRQETTSSPSKIIALCRLAGIVEFFIQDYARYTLPIMKQIGLSKKFDVLPDYHPIALPTSTTFTEPEQGPTSTTFTKPEQGRLQRAFCRFEIYRYIFARCSSSLDHGKESCLLDPSVTPSEQATMYLEKFPDFQITEILCVRDYLVRRLRGVCTQLEVEAIETMSPETFMLDPNRDEAGEWESGVYVFTESCKLLQTDHLEHLMSLGLPFIRELLAATGERKRDLFVRHCPGNIINHLETHFLSEAIEHLGLNHTLEHTPSLHEGDSDHPCIIDLPIKDDVPDAWLWAHPEGPPITLRNGAHKGLRDWGYVFWDYERLLASGILGHCSANVRRIRFDEHDAGRGPSVQERLLDAHQSKEVYEFFVRLFDEEQRDIEDQSTI